MRLLSRLRPAALAAVASLGLLGIAVGPAAAAPAGSLASQAGGGHFNVAQPHSPELMRELAGPQDAVGLALPGLRAAAAPLAAGPSGPPGAVQGVDVAAFQHPVTKQYPAGAPIDWSAVAGAGVQFAAVKATEGNYYVNPFYAADLAGAGAAGLPVIAYAFANPKAGNGTAAGQADYLVSHAGSAGGRTPLLMLDIEYNPYAGGECYGLTPAAMVTWVSGFDTQAKALTGRLPVIYTPPDWWATCTGGSTAFGSSALWDPEYTTAASPPLPAGWGDWAMWQYTSSGTVPGIASGGSTDLDAVNLISPGNQQATVGQAVSVPVSQAAAGPVPGLTYGGSGWPAGLTVDSAGLISGTPTVSDAAQPSTVTAATAGTVIGSVRISWDVHGQLSVTAPRAQRTVAGSPAELTVPAASAPAGQTVSFAAAGLPSGLVISSGGQITGWADTRPGGYPVTLIATDGQGDTGRASFTWTVTAAPDRGPAGAVAAGVRGRCLADTGARTRAGTKVETRTCKRGSAQRWTLAQDGTLRIGGKCLAVAGSPARSGSVADLAPCSGRVFQRWAVGTGAELVSAATRLCLTGPGSGSGITRIRSCAGKASQQWTLPAGPAVSQIPGGCLDDTNDRAASGTVIGVWPCDGRAAQDWTAAPDRTVRIHGKCLQAGVTGPVSARTIKLETCTGAAAQRWSVTADGAGTQLRNAASGLCLADPALSGSALASHPLAATGTCTAGDPALAWQLR
jgi:GH25 family lysozyme M1 (1,4-beta-N-acetylmuramidase)